VYWHGDCLDPPLTAYPSELGEETGVIDNEGVRALKERTWGEKVDGKEGFVSIRRKWMCPLHVEWAIRGRKRVGSGWKFVSKEEEKAYLSIMDEVDVVGVGDTVERPRVVLPEKGVILDFVSRVGEIADDRGSVKRVERRLPKGIGVAFTSFLGELYGCDVLDVNVLNVDTVVDPVGLRCTEDEADEVCT
jgi:hypothetical protein